MLVGNPRKRVGQLRSQMASNVAGDAVPAGVMPARRDAVWRRTSPAAHSRA
jgi:hypothetical protein